MWHFHVIKHILSWQGQKLAYEFAKTIHGVTIGFMLFYISPCLGFNLLSFEPIQDSIDLCIKCQNVMHNKREIQSHRNTAAASNYQNLPSEHYSKSGCHNFTHFCIQMAMLWHVSPKTRTWPWHDMHGWLPAPALSPAQIKKKEA